MTNAEKIVLRRLMKVSVDQRQGEPRAEFVASLAKNIESIGFTFSPDVVERLLSWSPEQLLEFAQTLIPSLLKMVGGDVEYQPMYPNFPTQVMEADAAELFLNAIYHYYGDWVGERILPYYDKQKRPALLIQKNLKVLGLAGDNEATLLCRDLISSNTSLSQSDGKELRSLLHHCKGDLQDVLPAEIPFKEIQSLVCAFLLSQIDDCADHLARYLRTATDLLRFATELSGGDVSLAGPTKLISFKRKHRRAILAVLDQIESPAEDLQRHRGKWIRLAERLHPGEFFKRYPNAFATIKRLRDGEKVVTFNSRVEACLDSGNTNDAVELLKSRPGEFARRLDHLLRLSDADKPFVVSEFALAAADVSTPVLLQLIAHFKQRALDRDPRTLQDVPEAQSLVFFDKAVKALTSPTKKTVEPVEPMRTVFPKGQTSKLMRVPLAKKLVAESDALSIVELARATLVERFAALPPLGTCFVAPELANYNVPFSQRSANKSLRTISRGSRIGLPKSNTLRFFLWWKEGKVQGKATGRVDLDLSATMYSDHWKYVNHISYTNLREKKLGCYHSGDITSAPQGASEFIDIDLNAVRESGVRYLVCSIQSFTGVPYCDLPQCYMGWMAREEPNSGEIYEPATVQDKLDLASDSRISIPMVVDLEEKTIVWADLSLRSMPNFQINIESNQRGLVHYGIGITTLVKPTLHELFSLHAQARGKLVESREVAQTVFSSTGTVTPFDFETIASEYLA